jgi:hypothetical protein
MVGASRGDPRLPHRGLRTAPAAANPLALRKGKLVRFSASEIGPFVSQAAAHAFANGHRQGERWLPAACRGTSKTGNGSGFADSEQQQTSRSVALRFVPIVQLAPAVLGGSRSRDLARRLTGMPQFTGALVRLNRLRSVDKVAAAIMPAEPTACCGFRRWTDGPSLAVTRRRANLVS